MTVTEHTRASFEAVVLDEYEEVTPRILYDRYDLWHPKARRLVEALGTTGGGT